MGPRPGGRGEGSVRFREGPCVELQWGRAPEGAERTARGRPALRVGCFNGAAPRRARRARFPSRLCRTSVGFNGAAPRRARRVTRGMAATGNQVQLQWGRAPEGAERCRRRAIRWPMAGFNGAAPRRARRDLRGCRTRCTPRRFNGAAPRRARRDLHEWVAANPEGGLQWGRAPEGAERVRRSRRSPARLPASMGPRPGGRGENNDSDDVVFHLNASMGPRPGGRGESFLAI